MTEVAVLIPCYNESTTIAKVVADVKKELPFAEIYVYDNNSTDGTDEIARNAGAKVRYCYQQGKGNVVRQMFSDIDAECYIMTDGDDTYPAEYARKMCEAVLDRNVDMVIGDRLSSTYFKENKRPFHNTGNRVVCGLINLLFGSKIKDVMTGYRAFSYRFVKTFPVLSKGFEIETEMSIHAVDKNLHIKNVICNYRDRPEGSESKLDTVPDGCKVLRMIMSLCSTYISMKFFGLIAFLLFISGLGFFIPVFVEYLQTGEVLNFPTLIMCCCVWMISIQCFFSGLVLEILHKKNKQDFEYKLIEASRRLRELNE